ncbi:hypothetical protein [Ruegeria sp. 6PALISEP08]|uniref:hypothetical protein n=1 Tax=Ruegeria sp. 6PALISEP08 TaxID=1225660 RepID=UPI00067EF540|nr:hypothetical protein [Ruegeria sp. 6PALISEP08]
MFLELIGTIFAGFAFAGVVLVLNKLTGGRLPKWTTPVAAGLGMIGMTIASEYSWYDRTVGTLPESMEIVQEVKNKSYYRPWTYAVPFVDRFSAIDTQSVRTNDQVPDQRLVDLYLFGRWAPVTHLPVAVNCAENSRANLVDGAEFADDGRLINASWYRAEGKDSIIETTCGV